MKFQIFILLVCCSVSIQANYINISSSGVCNGDENPSWGDETAVCWVCDSDVAYKTNCYLSRDKIVDAGDILMASKTVTQMSCSTLVPYRIDCNFGSDGAFYVIQVIDPLVRNLFSYFSHT